ALAGMEVAGIGSSFAPSGEALAFAAVRFGAPGYREEVEFSGRSLEGMDLANLGHFMRTLAYNGWLTLHLRATGGDDWQKVEALALALGRALRRAVVDGGDAGKSRA
ncbi:MAG: imidazoleglycerol-phosphate dehydratase, partial [Methanothrix sp.]|nr:imidazoleglycerol-phosphate dehydratase [Methanothrix sp.]